MNGLQDPVEGVSEDSDHHDEGEHVRRHEKLAIPFDRKAQSRRGSDQLGSDLPLPAHVNLIPLNPTPGYAVRGSPAKRVREFRDELRAGGVNATVRRTRGTEIDAACGQLRASHEVTVRTRTPKPPTA